jgi:hypothetical protein
MALEAGLKTKISKRRIKNQESGIKNEDESRIKNGDRIRNQE